MNFQIIKLKNVKTSQYYIEYDNKEYFEMKQYRLKYLKKVLSDIDDLLKLDDGYYITENMVNVIFQIVVTKSQDRYVKFYGVSSYIEIMEKKTND